MQRVCKVKLGKNSFCALLEAKNRSLRFPNLGWHQISLKDAGTVPDVSVDTKDNKPFLVSLTQSSESKYNLVHELYRG